MDDNIGDIEPLSCVYVIYAGRSLIRNTLFAYVTNYMTCGAAVCKYVGPTTANRSEDEKLYSGPPSRRQCRRSESLDRCWDTLVPSGVSSAETRWKHQSTSI